MPFTPTVKKNVLAASGNQCAHPDCQSIIFDPQSRTFLGQVAHIRGDRPGSARYDPDQIPAERQSYSNAIVLCLQHHRIADDNEAEYPADLLIIWKSSHEAMVASAEDRGWLTVPDSLTVTDVDGPLTLPYWIDERGRARVYSDAQLVIEKAIRTEHQLQHRSRVYRPLSEFLVRLRQAANTAAGAISTVDDLPDTLPADEWLSLLAEVEAFASPRVRQGFDELLTTRARFRTSLHEWNQERKLPPEMRPVPSGRMELEQRRDEVRVSVKGLLDLINQEANE